MESYRSLDPELRLRNIGEILQSSITSKQVYKNLPTAIQIMELHLSRFQKLDVATVD